MKGFSISLKRREIVNIIVLKAFILYRGELSTFSITTGTAPKLLQYVYRMDSGFMPKVGKLMPINDPVDNTRLPIYAISFGVLDFFALLYNIAPPRF